jgi:hypothetical protein
MKITSSLLTTVMHAPLAAYSIVPTALKTGFMGNNASLPAVG